MLVTLIKIIIIIIAQNKQLFHERTFDTSF